jgi:Bacterial protein of unknown function (DUF922)
MFFGLFLLRLFGLISATPPAHIVLQPERLSFTATEYNITAVSDQRQNRGNIGAWFSAPKQPAQVLDLAGGTSPALQNFIRQNLRQKPGSRPVALRLTECRITEKIIGNRVDGTFVFAVGFDLLKDADGETNNKRLTEYRTSANYTRPVNQTAVVENVVRQSLVAALTYFNGFMNREVKQDERLAKSLRVIFTDYVRHADNDTVFYDRSRPLTWADFRAKPRAGTRYAAEVNPNFGYEGRSRVVNGTIELSLVLKVYTLKSGSWTTPPALNDYSLNHEQRHFDIAKIEAERFKRGIVPDSLSLEDYNSNVQYRFIESFRTMNQRQQQYDDETNHGINQAVQERWNQRIERELQALGIK